MRHSQVFVLGIEKMWPFSKRKASVCIGRGPRMTSFRLPKQNSVRHWRRRDVDSLFVSRWNDKVPNGFNCAISHKDVSFMSQVEPEIWRHFGSKLHFLRDCRYRLDHEDYLYITRYDRVPVSSLSAELRAEIEKSPAVVLGKKNPFVENEVNALVSVESKVTPSFRIGGPFDLLRLGGGGVYTSS